MPLHIEVTGQGPPLVLLHGWALNLRVFDALVEALRPQLTLHAVDLPGHGRSAGPLATAGAVNEQILDELIERLLSQLPAQFLLCGWSLGGQLAMAIAKRAPQRLCKLVLVATTPRFTATTDWPHGVQANVLERLVAQLAEDYRGTVTGLLELQVRGSQHAAQVLQTLQHALFEHGAASPDALRTGLEWLGSIDLRACLGVITVPTLVIAGQYDRVTPPSAGRWIASQLRAGQFHEFARAGHAPFLSHPRQFSELIRQFLLAGTVAA